jgi:hypothetical protein
MAVGRTMADALRIGMGIFVFFSLANCAPVDGDDEIESRQALEQAPEWTPCAGNDEHCMFNGTREVRYGNRFHWTVKTFTDGVHCTGSAFDARTRLRYWCEYNAAEPVTEPVEDEQPDDMHHADAGTQTPADPTHEHDDAGMEPSMQHDDAGTGQTMHDMPMDLMPYVDESAIPVGDPGRSTVQTKPTAEQPSDSGDGTGAFRNVCQFSHMKFDDPIVFPGKERASHLHTFFGNTQTDASSTAESIRNTGNSTCRGGIANRTAYWVPALLDAHGRPQAPEEGTFYYKSGYEGIAPSSVKIFPQGLRMIAGSAKATSAQAHAYWGCFENYCGHVPTIPTVPVGEHVVMTVVFPQCWNGVDLDSSDHKSHMAYPENGACPSTHPVSIPEISFNILYKYPAGGMAGWRLASDMYDKSLPGGYSVHGDWFDGWDPEVAKTFVTNCTGKAKDCHSHLLGDGREIYY